MVKDLHYHLLVSRLRLSFLGHSSEEIYKDYKRNVKFSFNLTLNNSNKYYVCLNPFVIEDNSFPIDYV